jgi:hypothetical protein
LTILLGTARAQVFYVPGASGGQAPADIVKQDPHTHLGCTLASLGDPDPWNTCLVIGYKNVSATAITGIRFEVTFMTALKEPLPSIYVEDTQKVDPGKTAAQLWHDGAYWHDNGRDEMDANISVAKVMFADGTFWDAPTPAAPVYKIAANAILVRAANSLTSLRNRMRDPDSFVLEKIARSVIQPLSPERAKKIGKKQAQAYAVTVGTEIFCFQFRSRNGFGGMDRAIAEARGGNEPVILDANVAELIHPSGCGGEDLTNRLLEFVGRN